MEFSSTIFNFDAPSDGGEDAGGAGYEAQGSQDVTDHWTQEFSFPQDNYPDQNMGTRSQQDSFITPGANNEFGVMQPLVPGGSQMFGDARDCLPTLNGSLHLSPLRERQPARGSLPDLGSVHYPLGSGVMNMQNTNQPMWPPTEPLNMNSGHCAQAVMPEAYRNPQVGSEWTSMSPNAATQAVNSRDQIWAAAMYSPARAVRTMKDSACSEARFESSRTPTGQQSIIPSPVATVMAAGYDVFNPHVLAQVENDCETDQFSNTPSTIETYHQLAMADDLFYNGTWREKFLVNGGAIVEYHNPAPSRPHVPDNERKDRRLLLRFYEDKQGEKVWYKAPKETWQVPTKKVELPPAEWLNILNLRELFSTSALCTDAEKYAELVAPRHIDRSPEAHRKNLTLLGWAPGAEIPDLIPTSMGSSPVVNGIAGVQAAKPAQADAGAASDIQSTSTGAFHDPSSNTAYFNTLPGQGMVSGSTNPFNSLPSLPGWIWPFTPEGVVNSGSDANVADMSATSHLAVGNDGMNLDAAGLTFDPFGMFPGFDGASGAADSSFGFFNPYSTGIPPNGENYSVFEDMANFDAAAAGHTTTSDSNNGFNLHDDNSSYTGNSTIGNHTFGNAPMFGGSFDGSLFATNSSDGNDFFANSFHLPCINEEQAEDTPMTLG
ncbi:hypothetical protein F5Y01DRAFT_327495 [Xylaria sp. FL0043]|nr:hypothetical protein F5Y01DRAFT_327495 [Xylaria sp. FL0043]